MKKEIVFNCDLQKIDNDVFQECISLEKFVYDCDNPVKLDNVLSKQFSSDKITLYIPKKAKKRFIESGWGVIKNIKEYGR